MLAAVIAAKAQEEALESLEKAKQADLIELRLDYLNKINDEDIESLVKKTRIPIIVTCRKKPEGGFFSGNQKQRMQILKKAVELRADFVDIENSSDKACIKDLIKHKNKTKIIISYHNFKETPANPMNIYDNIKKLNPDLIKIVTYANSVSDNFKIFDIIKSANKDSKPIISFCMGPYGQFSRVLSVILGSKITYASVQSGKESATGQLTISEMLDYRIKNLNKNTKIFGLIGNPVEHSCSHIIHNASFEKTKTDAVYLKFRVDKLKYFVDYFRKLNSGGFSVTIPHKIEVMRYLDEIDDKSKEIGAVNTILVEDGKWIGCNTDCDGAMQALKEKTRLKGKKVALLGSGGSARAICYGLKENGADVVILNRTVKNAKLLAERFDCSYQNLYGLNKVKYDILVNTTPIGMYPYIHSSPIKKDSILEGSVVFDIVFNPPKTRLLQDAEKRNCKIVHGIEMLIKGSALQFKLWTGKKAPLKSIRKKVLTNLENDSNQN